MAQHPVQSFRPTYAVPIDTARLLRLLEPKSTPVFGVQTDNFSLAFHRLVPNEAINTDDLMNDRGRAEDKVRSRWLKDLVKGFNVATSADLREMIQANAAKWSVRTQNAMAFLTTLQSRLIVGLGGKGPIEIGITVHPVTGLPFIPGSALKGLARNYALLSLYAEVNGEQDHLDSSAIEAFDKLLCLGEGHKIADTYAAIFGVAAESGDNPGQGGGCIFHDAVLTKCDGPIFTLDVMTPHFKEYYNSGNAGSGKPTTPPHDADSPNPVTFIAVTEGAEFGFAVGTRPGVSNKLSKRGAQWLARALEEFGIGAKTASGYGAFKRVE